MAPTLSNETANWRASVNLNCFMSMSFHAKRGQLTYYELTEHPSQVFLHSGSSHISYAPTSLQQRMTRSPPKMAPGRRAGRQTAISDFFANAPQRPQKRRSHDRSPARVGQPPDSMQIEPPTDPAQELTQEELDVHDQLESLGYSKKRPRGTPPDDTDGTPPRGEPSDGDESDDSLIDIERDVALRRSSRITREVVRFGCALDRPRGTSVFGTGFSRNRSSARDMKRALREVNQKAKQEERLEEIRKELDETGKAGKDETLFQEMADAEEKAERIRREAQDKYSAPVPLFCKKVSMRSMPKEQKKRRSGTYAMHPLHDFIVQALKTGDDDSAVALAEVASLVKPYCRRRNTKGLARVADYLLQLAVFDPTDEKPSTISRDLLVEAIEDIVRADVNSFISRRRLPDVISVLKDYGAVFDDMSDLRKVGDVEMVDGSLDQQVRMTISVDKDDKIEDSEIQLGKKDTIGKDGKGEKNKYIKDDSDPPPLSDEFIRCERNLRRLFRIAALQVRHGVPLGGVISGIALGLEESVLLSLGICTRVLLSSFGNRLYNDVGELIDASLSLIDKEDWPGFRMKAAAYIHSFTTRLELHVELMTYLFPYINPRARFLRLDIGYLSLQQWCSANTPSTITTKASARAREMGIEKVSFCLSDIVRHMQSIPDLRPNTDMIWISLIARLVKVLVADESVMERRMAGDFGGLKQVLARMKFSTRTLRLDVPVQRMRIAVDTIEGIMQEFAKGNERKEVGLNNEGQNRQRQGRLAVSAAFQNARTM